MKSKKKFKIVLLEEHEKVNFYSIQFNGEKLSEFEKFLLENKTKNPNDITKIIYRISKIGENGAYERHFRYAGKTNERIFELPASVDKTNLRLYCLIINENIVILGNGGEKTTRTYNEDEFLNNCVAILNKIDAVIKLKEKNKQIVIEGNILNGILSLYI